MAEYIAKTFMCRAARPAKVYQNVHDHTPHGAVLKSDSKFYSNKQYVTDTVTLYHITEDISGKSPIGAWCSESTLQLMEMNTPAISFDDVPTMDDSVQIDIELLVRSTPTVYTTSTGSKTALCDLDVDDQIICDREVTINVNGSPQVRYHIAEVKGEDQTVTNMWVAFDRSVQRIEPSVDDHSIMLLEADENTGGGGGSISTPASGGGGGTKSNPTTQVSTPDGTVTLPSNVSDSKVETDNVTINYGSLSDPELLKKLYEDYDMDFDSATTTEGWMSQPIGRMTFVHGMPFQFTHITDRRNGSRQPKGASDAEDAEGRVSGASSDMYGRTFAKDIAANMPIAVIVPGKAKFLTNVKSGLFGGGGASKDKQEAIIPIIFNSSDTTFGSALEGLMNIEGDYQYYSLEVDTENYFKYVNSMCHASARLMGIEGERYQGEALGTLDWGKVNSDATTDFNTFSEVVGLATGVSFAYDPASSVSDTINNTTGESKFASFFNNINSQAREIEFIMGYSGIDPFDFLDSQAGNYVESATQSIHEGGFFAGMSNAIDRVGSWLQNSLHGMNMRFPEIWNESSHTRSYDIDMHFIAPYSTKFCKWRYVLVPFFHIFCLGAPKSDANVSQYAAPFLIRAYSKGYFNVEMGIIESLTWKRYGDGDMISDDGVPTQIDVSVGFKDLYHVLTMTNAYSTKEGKGITNINNFFNNTGLMDLIGTLSGVNMNRISLTERLSMFASTTVEAFGSLGSNFMKHISDRARNVIETYFVGI